MSRSTLANSAPSPLLRRGRQGRLRLGADRRADPEAAISKRERPAGRHHDGAEPDQQDERLVIHSKTDPAVALYLAQAGVDLAQPQGHDAGLRGRRPARDIEALGGLEWTDHDPVA